MRFFLAPFLLISSSTLALAHPLLETDVLLVTKRAEDSSLPHPKGPLPALQRKHRNANAKKSSAAFSRARRAPVDNEGMGTPRLLEAFPSSGMLLTSLSPSGLDERDVIPVASTHGLSLIDFTDILTTCTSGMSTHQNNIQRAAKKARKYKESRMSSPFQNSVYQELKAYRGSAAGLPGLKELDDKLKPLGPDQGLANFNRDDPIQVMLRTSITSLQDTLEAIDLIIFYIPVLGPVLGPIVYDIKCIIDDVLNIGEVVLDGLLNNLSPQLTSLSGNYLASTCKMAPSYSCCS